MERILGFPLLPLGGLPLEGHPCDDFPLAKQPPLDLFEGKVLWKGDKVRVEEGVTIEGAKEQEDRTWSQIIELDRGGSTSKDEESGQNRSRSRQRHRV